MILNWVPISATHPPRRHSAISGNSLGCYSQAGRGRGELLASACRIQGRCSSPTKQRQSSATKKYLAQSSVVLGWEMLVKITNVQMWISYIGWKKERRERWGAWRLLIVFFFKTPCNKRDAVFKVMIVFWFMMSAEHLSPHVMKNPAFVQLPCMRLAWLQRPGQQISWRDSCRS